MFLYWAVHHDIIHGCQTLSRGNPSQNMFILFAPAHTQQKKDIALIENVSEIHYGDRFFTHWFDVSEETGLKP